jgi:hypothetical protein
VVVLRIQQGCNYRGLTGDQRRCGSGLDRHEERGYAILLASLALAVTVPPTSYDSRAQLRRPACPVSPPPWGSLKPKSQTVTIPKQPETVFNLTNQNAN